MRRAAIVAQMKMGQERVGAYHLGIVKDTPDAFEVRTGKWIRLTDSQIKKQEKIIDITSSITPDQIFPKEPYTKFMRNDQAVVNPVGVAIFVAELKFADGRTWRQDTKRDALLWDN